ncbi:hypothetical protein M3J09_000392 [Ascochyta lentis]
MLLHIRAAQVPVCDTSTSSPPLEVSIPSCLGFHFWQSPRQAHWSRPFKITQQRQIQPATPHLVGPQEKTPRGDDAFGGSLQLVRTK